MNNAIAAISSIDKGRAISELQEAITGTAKAVMEFGAKGEVTLKLIVRPTGEGVEFEVKISVKQPKAEIRKANFFVTEEGELSREDPNQPELPVVAQMTATE